MRPRDDASDHTLAVIDQTLAGEPVSPQDADLAELTLILAGQRSQRSDTFAAQLDARVARGFASPPAAGGPDSPGRRSRPVWRDRRRWLYAPGVGLAGIAVAVAVAIVGGGSTPPPSLGPALTGHQAARSASGPGPAVIQPGNVSSSSAAASPSASAGSAASAGSPGSAAATPSGSLSPSAPNRQVIQAAQLTLSTRPAGIEDAAREVFAVVAAQHGVVDSSNVTATNGPDGSAQFSLTVPSANLGSAMAGLSRLHGTSVISRNDVSQDVTGRAGGAGQRLADARALRTALLRKLALATTTAAIDSLRLQIRDANASIASDVATLRQLQRQVANSQIDLSITAVTPAGAPRPTHSGGGFTLGRAMHDAGRVLVVAAGVGLIALAVLVPVGLVVALGLWIAVAVRRHRRRQVLDLV